MNIIQVIKDLDEFIIDNGCVRLEDTVMNKGRESPYYINIRNIAENGYQRMRDFSLYGVEFYNRNMLNGIFVGIPSCATHFANEINRQLLKIPNFTQMTGYKDLPPIELRKTPKAHGNVRNKHFAIAPPRGARLIVLEDTTTVARTITEKIPHIEEAGYQIESVVCIVDRLEISDDRRYTARSAVEDMGYKFHSMTDSSRLLPKAVKRLNPSQDRIDKIRAYSHWSIPCPI